MTALLRLKSLITILALTLSLNAYAQQEKLIFSLDVIRHGDRTPIHEIPQAPHEWSQGLGQLTPRGMQQEYQLGLAMHKRYIEETQLLPEHYNAETLYLRSSDYDRTLMSAESLLLGLYPLGSGPSLPQSNTPALPSAYQVMPIHTAPQDSDDLFVDHQKFRDLLEKYVFSRPDWLAKTAELQPQFARWSELTGVKINHLSKLIALGDTLMIRRLYQLPLPTGLTQQDADTIIEAGEWAMATEYKSSIYGQATVQALLVRINDYLEQARQHQTKLKWVLFSAHDATILGLLSALQVPLDKPPVYASDLRFSLYETSGGETLLKITLNGETITAPACGKLICKNNIV